MSRMKIQMEPIKDPRLEAVSDLTLKHVVSLVDAVQNSTVFAFLSARMRFLSSASFSKCL